MPSYYITPQTTISVCRNVPWDKSYRNSLRPENLANQSSQISSYIIDNMTFTNQTYQRISDNVVRLGVGADLIRDANYLIINNGAGFPQNKTYYAFIDNVEYINNNACEITYELDYIQTYYFDFVFEDVFIEREHTETDEIGENTVPESLELGEMICHYQSGKYFLKDKGTHIIVMYTPNLDESKPFVNWNNGVPVSVDSSTFDQSQLIPGIRNNLGGMICFLDCPVNNVIQNYTATFYVISLLNAINASIVGVFSVNNEIAADNYSNSITYHDFNVNEQNSFLRLDGTRYSDIKNKKLLQYPFKRLVVSNNNGNQAEYKWEQFTTRSGDNVQAQFTYLSAFTPSPKAFIYPTHYRGIAIDYESGVTLEDFPQPSWTEDSYSKWWAQNKANFGISLASNVLSSGLMMATGGASAGARAANFANIGSEALANMGAANQQGFLSEGWKYNRQALGAFQAESQARKSGALAQGVAGAHGLMGIAGALGQLQTAKATPDQTHVQDNSAIINYIRDRLGWTFYDIGITGEMAEIIDDYFNMFGYAVHKVKQPCYKSPSNPRPFYNYTKTQNCCLKSQNALPSEAQEIIEKIFDGGITLWAHADQIGNYSLDNSPH